MNSFLEKANTKISLFHHQFTLVGNDTPMGTGEEALFDCGNHFVGNISLEIEPCGHHFDAPLYLQINFYEHNSETSMHEADYHGWISPSWIQEEKIHIDVLPCELKLDRRYAFRYIAIKVLGASENYKVKIKKIEVDSVSSISEETYQRLAKEETNPINRVCLRTLRECMQEIFEDGPKRDRRLWLGDLRLQALTNYKSFRKNDLVKKCLYLFAVCQNNDGTLPCNLFLTPKIEGDYQVMADYSLLFIPTLLEYYENTNDLETLKELFEIADKQHEIYSKRASDCSLENERCFVDWNLQLDKSCALYGVYLYCLEALIKLYKILNKNADELIFEQKNLQKIVRESYFDKNIRLFTSGKGRQISYASQIWMVLGGVADGKIGKQILEKIKTEKTAEQMVSPYLYHYYVEALIKLDLFDEAKSLIDYYWGEMLKDGADTFYEIFNPLDKDASPYGGKIVHSFCHAWSCTPYYFNKKYLGR